MIPSLAWSQGISPFSAAPIMLSIRSALRANDVNCGVVAARSLPPGPLTIWNILSLASARIASRSSGTSNFSPGFGTGRGLAAGAIRSFWAEVIISVGKLRRSNSAAETPINIAVLRADWMAGLSNPKEVAAP